ncbi:xanthine dehydrogenase family protein molybdopterin-binding subunit [Xanthobacter tagetidis]|uniref:xanthine dehydrogenase family protein molybdopterin-binding subunit n=1 Tax=Xanthobacter tagetidis TaxID=60216 RepID=UPI001832BF7D|nr:molybdopterin cofactor-binding domain-containing protein [Xanthobacter tagetidis]MBB6306486.1 2-furoyl-CoA dehydrogenase large subunit [Xanthobacter tagetidis]
MSAPAIRSAQAEAPSRPPRAKDRQSSSPLGQPIPRKEDEALLRGRGRYADDVPAPAGTLHAYVVRSPIPHGLIRRIDVSRALALPGVHAVLTGEDVARLSDPFLVALKQPIPQWTLAVERVRFVGEPVALVLAEDRYIAEDASELVDIAYEPLPAIVDPEEAVAEGAPLVHPDCKSNEVSRRDFTYGDPDKAFAEADKVVKLRVDYPRNSFMPMECFVVVAQFRPSDGSFDVLANFQGPFSAHPVMARALRVSGAKLRLRTPADSGGSFGIKLSVFPFVVLMGLAARISGRPVKWVEDRYEHLLAASSGPNRVTHIEAAVKNDGRITALRMDQMEDYGAFLRAPMPGPLYRMHGATTGAYDVPNLYVVNRVVLTNKAPAALIRGFGGPQLYLGLERLVQRIALALDMDVLDVIRKNLVPSGAFPYRAAAGALYDSGDYPLCVDIATGEGRLEDLKRRRDAARAKGRHYGIGFAAVVEPSMSNMGYLSTMIPASARERAGPKNGAVSLATVNVDPLGTVSVTADLTVQGQGHETVISQIVCDQLGLKMDDVVVNLEMDTVKDQWSIAAGTYSCRFSPGTAVAVHHAAGAIRDKLARIAANQLNVLPEDIEFVDGMIRSKTNPDNGLAFARVAGTAHWSPVMLPDGMAPGLRETATWAPPELEPPSGDDRINTSLAYGFVFDMCGVEIDPDTWEVRVDRYVSMHDAGRLLNPLIAEGQIRGAFVQGLATALYEEFRYDDKGGFLTGTLADYLIPTVTEVPEIELLHIESPSPFTALGAKGLAEGNCMSTPVCIANAVADALGIEHVPLPVTPMRLHALMAGPEKTPPRQAKATSTAATAAKREGARELTGSGAVTIGAPVAQVWRALLDPENLKATIPGCHALDVVGENDYRAEVSLGVGPVKGRFRAEVRLSDLDPERSGRLSGGITGPLGDASGAGMLRLEPIEGGTRISYDYEVAVGGRAAAIGGRLLDGAADLVIRQFFERFASRLGASSGAPSASWWNRLTSALRKPQ